MSEPLNFEEAAELRDIIDRMIPKTVSNHIEGQAYRHAFWTNIKSKLGL